VRRHTSVRNGRAFTAAFGFLNFFTGRLVAQFTPNTNRRECAVRAKLHIVKSPTGIALTAHDVLLLETCWKSRRAVSDALVQFSLTFSLLPQTGVDGVTEISRRYVARRISPQNIVQIAYFELGGGSHALESTKREYYLSSTKKKIVFARMLEYTLGDDFTY
jgi:hypothetical protein